MLKAEHLWNLLIPVIAGAALLAALEGSPDWVNAWVAYTILLAVSAASLVWLVRYVAASRGATVAALTAFLLRLSIGVALTLLLPVVGYPDSAEHQAGYAFTDAYIRDTQAWELASSDESILRAFAPVASPGSGETAGEYSGDQYGGMLALSAVIYRLLSPDAHRPMLILVLTAAASAWGVLLLWRASQSWLDGRISTIIAWVFAVYPESVLLGSSQMREALIIPAVAMTFYGLVQVQARQRSAFIWLLIAGTVLFPIQPLAGFVTFGMLLGVWLFDPTTLAARKQRKTLVYAAILVAGSGIALLLVGSILANLPSVQGSGPLGAIATWLRNNFMFQTYLSERSSGMFQKLVDSLGEQWLWLIVLVYGIAQPVLPAVVGDPGAAWIMRLIGFFRAAGWYTLAPFLIYGGIGALRAKTESRRPQLAWLTLAIWAWIAVAALNAGGDQWDNPRYRVIMLTWQVLLAAWAWSWARTRRDAWLGRWLAVEAVFVILFTQWYISRYYPGMLHLDIRIMILATLVITAVILVGGYIWDKRKGSKSLELPANLGK